MTKSIINAFKSRRIGGWNTSDVLSIVKIRSSWKKVKLSTTYRQTLFLCGVWLQALLRQTDFSVVQLIRCAWFFRIYFSFDMTFENFNIVWLSDSNLGKMLDIKPTADYLSRNSTFGQFSMLFGKYATSY